jgi:hypothetical protein
MFHKNVICASIFTGVYDVNRNEMLFQDDFSIVEKWYHSIQNSGLNGIIFHNNFSDETIAKCQSNAIQFIKVDFNGKLNGNVYRYIVYYDFLKKYGNQIENIFFTDIGDVEVIKSPFDDPYFQQNANAIFCGDEVAILDNEWMYAHCTHLRNSIANFADFEKKYKSEVLLNCGIIGGKASLLLLLMKELSRIHNTVTASNQTPYTLDMGAFNYIARTAFSEKIIHGFPVNTRFKAFETNRIDCWFRHK